MRDAYHCIAFTTCCALGSTTDEHTDKLARIAFDLVYTSHMVQAIYQALQSSASLGPCFWINPSGINLANRILMRREWQDITETHCDKSFCLCALQP